MMLRVSLVSAALLLFTGCMQNGEQKESKPLEKVEVVKGKLRIGADKEDATIYVNGKKKAMTGEGFSSLLLAEGEYEIKVEKNSDDGEWIYSQTKKVFVGADSSVKISFELERIATKQREERLAREKKEKEERLAREKKEKEERLAREKKEKNSRFKKYNFAVASKHSIKDLKTGLVWQDDSDAKNVEKRWIDAQSYCKSLKLDGKSDWRLPSYNELLSIVDYNKYDPAIVPVFENVASSSYWSSSLDVSNSVDAWKIMFENGDTGRNGKSNEYNVRCVRSR